jgi:hypothetical protein
MTRDHESYRLTADDLADAERAARRFQACWWQGTSGTLAAWVILLIKERKLMDVEAGDVMFQPTALRPGSREFVAVLEELKQLHLAKTLDYGVDEDALANIRQSAAVVGMPPWSGAILRIADKMHRLKAFHARGRCEFDGVDDTLKDIACYAAIALVLYREAAGRKPPA